MNDFVNFPEYSSPWLTPPITPADAQLSPSCSANSAYCRHIMDGATTNSGSYKVTADDESSILGWVRENTKMKLIDGDTEQFAGGAEDRLNASRAKINHHNFINNNKASMMLDVKQLPIHYNSSHIFNIINNSFSQHSPKPPRSKPLLSIPCLDDMDGMKSSSNRRELFSNDETKIIDKKTASFDCEYDDINGDDGGDLVMEFLEAYRRIPEISKFQSKVFLKLSKNHSFCGQPLFLCPDDSKRFITLHDFSAYQFKDPGDLNCCSNNVDECGCNVKSHSSTHCRQSCNNNWKSASIQPRCQVSSKNCSNKTSTSSATTGNISCNFINIDQHPTKSFNSNNCSKSGLNASVQCCSTQNNVSTYVNNIQTHQQPCHNINKNMAICFNKNNSYSKQGNCGYGRNSFTDRTAYAKTYAFDRIFMSEEDMKKVYVESFSSVLKAAITGHDGCVVVYGDGDVYHQNGKMDKYGCIHLLMKWLFVLIEEASHDSSSSFGVKMSASEILADEDSMKDLLNAGCENEERIVCSESYAEQLKALRVTNYREASDIIDKFISARTDAPSNLLITVKMKRCHAPIPGQRRDISSTNHLHMIKLSEKKQKKPNDDSLLSSFISSHNQSSPQSQDNLISFIGYLMTSPKSLLTETARIKKVLQDCVAPSSVLCQSCLLLVLSQNTTGIEDMQKLLHLGTKIYKRRLSSKSRQLRSGQSSPSEASSCASSGISSYRKSRVRMGTRQWQKQAAAVTNDTITAIPDGHYSNFTQKQQQAVVTLTPVPTRPKNLQLKSIFGPRETLPFGGVNSQLTRLPPLPSPLKGNWRHLGACQGVGASHIHDTILESPEGEERWDRMQTRLLKLGDSHGRPFMNSQETWVDGPASVMDSPYVNISKFNHNYENKWIVDTSKNMDRPMMERGCYRSEHASHHFSSSNRNDVFSASTELRHKAVNGDGLLIQSQCSDAAYRVLTSSKNQSFYPISSLKKGFTCSIQPIKTLDRNLVSCSEIGGKRGFLGKATSRELLTEKFKFTQQDPAIKSTNDNNVSDKSDLISQSFGYSTFQQSLLDNNSLCLESSQVKNTRHTHDCFMSSSLYERQLEENLEDISAVKLSGIKYLASGKPVTMTNSKTGGFHYDGSAVNINNLKTNMYAEPNHFDNGNGNISRETNSKNDINNNKDGSVAAKVNNNSIVSNNKKTKPEKYKPLKKLKQFFSKNPFKISNSPMSKVSKQQQQPIPLNNIYTLPALPESVSSKSPTCTILNQLNSSFDRSQKKRFSFFSRHRGSLMSDLIATAPTTPSMYYDNQAANGTLGSVSGDGVKSFIFPSLVNQSNIAETKKVSLTGKRPSLDFGIAKTALPESHPATVFIKSERSMSLAEGPSPTNEKCAFFKEEAEEDDRSQVESSVANVVCYKRIPFSRKTNDYHKAVIATSSALEPSYYRFSKFSSDGDFDGDYATLDSYRSDVNHENLNNNNNDDTISKSYVKDKIRSHDNDDGSNDDDDDDSNKCSSIDCKYNSSKCNHNIINTLATSCSNKQPFRGLSNKKGGFGSTLKEKAVKRRAELLFSRLFLCSVQ